MTRKIIEINESERRWIEDNLSTMRDMLGNIPGRKHEDGLTPANLDRAHTAWLSAHQRGVDDPNPIINAFGIAFGQHLIEVMGLEWKVVSDEYGTDIAVHGQPGDILIFPTNLIAKRYEKNETGFFENLFTGLKDQIDKVRRKGK